MSKKKGILLYTALVCLLLAFCVFRAASSRTEETICGEQTFVPGMAEEAVVYDQISLKPGVYAIQLQYRTDQDYSGHCNVKDDTVHPRALLTNGEHFYAGLTQTSYYLWLFEPTQALQITVSYGGETSLETGALTIRNTGKIWSMLFVLVFGAAVLGYGVTGLSIYNRKHGIRPETKQAAFFLFLIVLCASLSQIGGYLLGGADLTYHLQRIEGVKDSLLAGQFPIRIEPRWLYDHGYANGIFYCDALLYLPALLRLAGFPITTAYNIYCICLNIATAWISWYCFSKIFEDSKIGLMCSALYTLSIIRLYKLAVVGAVGEGSAMTFLPLIFYGMYRVFTEDIQEKRYRTAWLPLAFGYAGLIQTHVLTCEITAFLTILICLVCIRKVLNKAVFWELCKGALGALGLSLWYLVPFLDYYLTQDMHIRHVSGRTIQERGLYPAQLFAPSWSVRAQEMMEQKGLTGVEPVSPGLLCMAAVLLFLILWAGGILRRHKTEERTRRVFCVAKLSALFACLLLAMTLRIFPWDRIQESSGVAASLVSSLQFPNRFLGWTMVFLVMVFGACVLYFQLYFSKKQWNRRIYVAGMALVLLSIVSGSGSLMRDAMSQEHRLYLYNEAGMGFGYISGAEYLVEGTDESRLTFTGPKPGEHIKLSGYDKGYLSARISCENTGDTESYIDLPLLLYKGYRARCDTGQQLTVADGENHLVRVLIPGGFKGTFEVSFVSPLYWRISEIITLITIIGIGYFCVALDKSSVIS